LELTFWRTSSGQEVDFILGDKQLAIEVKSREHVHPGDLSGLTALAADETVEHRLIVAGVQEPQTVSDQYGRVEVLPLRHFVEALWAGSLL
jgi:predicted AAA+ superfamily ATPase